MKITVAFIILMYVLAVSSVLALDDPDLVFYFSFDGAIEGDTVLDESGKGHNGTVNGDINIVEGGKRGNAAEFARTSFIDMDGPNIPEEDVPRDEITICAWVRCEKTGDHHAIFNARAGDSTWLIHPELRSEGNFRWLLRSDGSAGIFDIYAGVVDWEEWIHYAGVYDGKKGILYINGENIAEQSGSAKIAKDWGQGARVGYNIDNARPFTGLMDDICLWKRALSEEEIRIVMEQGPAGIIGGMVSPLESLTTTWGSLKTF